MRIIRPKVRPTCTPKNLEKGVIWFLMEKVFKRGRKIQNFGGSAVDKIGCSGKSFILKFKGYGCVNK